MDTDRDTRATIRYTSITMRDKNSSHCLWVDKTRSTESRDGLLFSCSQHKKVAKIRRLHWWQWFPKFSFQHMSLYSNTAISGSNVDIPTLEEISRFTHAPIYRCSRPKRYTQLTIINKIDLKECHSLTVWEALFASSCLDAEVRKVNYTTFLKTKR